MKLIVLRDAGQALVPALLLLSACGVAWAALYNLGQVASARARLTHAADAAAYSAALAQARALNLLAYINRAQVAHQVAMAHLVTLASWARFSDTQAVQRGIGNPPAGLIAALFGTKAGAGYRQARDTGGLAGQLARAYAAHDDLVHDVLWRAARRQLQDLPAQRAAMLQSVLRENYPELSSTPDALGWRWLADGWPGYVRERAGRDGELEEMSRLAAGRYDFLQPRDFTRRSDWIVHERCPTRRHELRRRGDTRLDERGNWSSIDTLSYHALRANRWIGCYFREYPMGWGHAGQRGEGAAVERAPQDFSQQDFWRWVMRNTSWDIFGGRSNPLASAYAGMARVSMRGRGLPGVHEVSGDRPLRFAIAVRQAAATLHITDGASRIAWTGAYAWRAFGRRDSLIVTSAAETYFSRPQGRKDGREEAATLFRPYWQARRVAVDAEESAAARGMQ